MSNSEMTRKRLNSLKALTEELKDRTKNAPLDLSHIKELLSNTRQLHTSTSHRPPAPDSAANLPTDSVFRSQSRNTELEEEVMLLRQENLSLEQKITQLKEEIGVLEEQKRKLQAATQNNTTHCFKISESVEGCVERLALPAENYDRLEYSTYDIELRLDRIVLLRREKGAVQQFELCSLRGVEYCGPTVMVLRFEEFLEEPATHPNTSVFLKFYSPDHLQKWDLALFANYHIVNSLEEKRLFERHFRAQKLDQEAQAQNERIKNIRESTQLDKKKEKDLLKMLIEKREEYLQVKSLINQKLEDKIKANIALNKEEKELIGESKEEELEKLKQEPFQKPQSNIQSSIERIEELEPHQEQSQKLVETKNYNSQQQHMPSSQPHNSFHIRHTDSNLIGNIQPTFISPDHRIIRNTPASSSLHASRTQGNFPLSPPPFIPGSQSQLRESKATLVNQLSNGDGRRQSSESSFHNNSVSKFKEAGQERVNSAKSRLQNGYFATKYSKDGFSPHDKKIFLSLDSRKLCWSDRDKQSEYKSVPVAVLIGVEYGIVGEGVAKHVKNPDSRYFCVIQYYTSDYKKKTIQLGSGNMQDIKDMAADLAIIIYNRQTIAPS